MRKKTFTLAIALGCGLAAALVMVRQVINLRNHQTAGTPKERQGTVVVARADIPDMTIIKSEMLETRKQPAREILPTVIRDPGRIVGRMTATKIFAGRPIVDGEVAIKGASGLIGKIPAGRRAMTVKVTEVSGVAGFLRPGSHVDILMTIQSRPEIGPTRTKTILQNIVVSAVGQMTQLQADKTAMQVPTVTVLVTAAQAERLSLAVEQGTITLILRPASEETVAQTSGTTMVNLLSDRTDPIPLPALQPKPKPIPVVARAPEPAPPPKVKAPELPRPVREHTVAVYRGVKDVQKCTFVASEDDAAAHLATRPAKAERLARKS